MSNTNVKYPCRGCIYFGQCGENMRTLPCEGRTTVLDKKEPKNYINNIKFKDIKDK